MDAFDVAAGGLLLVPDLAIPVLGWSLLVIGGLSAVSIGARGARRRTATDATYRSRADPQAIVAAASTALFAVAGLSLVAGTGGGLSWLVPAMFASFAIAVLDSWVLLVEINR